MYNVIWVIDFLQELGVYQIKLHYRSFFYSSFPERDREWKHDNLAELMAEAEYVTKQAMQFGDHYGKNEERYETFFHLTLNAISNIAAEKEKQLAAGTGCLILLLTVICLFEFLWIVLA